LRHEPYSILDLSCARRPRANRDRVALARLQWWA